MNNFDQIWKLLEQHGGVANFYKTDCARLWDTCTPQEQQAVYETVRTKLLTGKFVNYNPVLAIKENIPKLRGAAEPKDYNGTPELESVRDHSRIACYNGHWGIYTFEDIKLFNLQTKD